MHLLGSNHVDRLHKLDRLRAFVRRRSCCECFRTRHSRSFVLTANDQSQVLAHVVPYYLDPHQYRRPAIHGPWLNSVSDAWLAYVAAQGNRSERVHELHEKYGKFVRIAPNHISIADPDAIQVRYFRSNITRN